MRRAMIIIALAGMLASAAPAQAYNAPGPRWPGGTIRYTDSLPPSWNPTIRQAVRTWNTSGVKVRFVRVPPGRAQVTIRYGDANGYDGYASIGRQAGAYVEMNRSVYKPLRPDSRIPAAKILAHELGHVLGLDHVGGTCRLMNATVLSGCPEPPQPWLYDCAWLSKDDLRGAISLYGGKARKPARKWCPLEPKPPALQDVRFTSGDPVRITWTPPKGLREGSSAVVEVYEQSRCQGDTSAGWLDVSSVKAQRGEWLDDSYREPGTYCYEVSVESQYGQRSNASRGLATYSPAPPAPPVVRSLTEYPDEYSDYRLVADVPQGASLHVDVSDSGQCTTAPGKYTVADQFGDSTWYLQGIPEGPVCLSLFSVDRVPSAPLNLEVVHAPRPLSP